MQVESSSLSRVGAVLSARYRLVRLLGEGAVGAVFEAQDLKGHGRYAIKVLHPAYARQKRVLSRFRAEASETSGLIHPNIARCFSYAEAEDGSPYILMELLDGAPLTSYLQPGLGYGAPQAVPIVHAVLAALTEAHVQGIVHLDIKPDNVFLVRDPQGPPIVKVLDFGIAKIIDAAGGMMSETPAGVMLGTPGYMSPEQIRSARTVDARSDLWSVGIVLYELLTGRAAFVGPTEADKLAQIKAGDPLPVDQGKPELAPWRGFFARALAREPDHRFGSAADMDRALMATAAQVARSAGSSAPGPAATTDMSPELPKGISQSSVVPNIRVVSPTPVPPSPATRVLSDSTLKAGEMAMIEPSGAAIRLPLWVVVLVGLLGVALGFAAGFWVGQK